MKNSKKFLTVLIFTVLISSFTACGSEAASDNLSSTAESLSVSEKAEENEGTVNEFAETTDESDKSSDTADETNKDSKTDSSSDKTSGSTANHKESEWQIGEWYVNGADYLECLKFDTDGKWYLYNQGGNLLIAGDYDNANPASIKLYEAYYEDDSLNTHAFVGKADEGQSGPSLYLEDDFSSLLDYDSPVVFLREGELPPEFFEAHDMEDDYPDLLDIDEASKIIESIINGKSYRSDGNTVIDDCNCYLFSVGENNDGQFTVSEHYAVSIYGDVYLMDAVSGEYQRYS